MPPSLRSLPPQPKHKKRKTLSSESSSSSSNSGSSSTLAQIQTLETNLLSAVQTNASLNELADLLRLVTVSLPAKRTCASSSTGGVGALEQELVKGVYALYRVFTLVVGSGKMSSVQGVGSGEGGGKGEGAKMVKAWLWERLNEYRDFLAGLLRDEEKVLRTSALKILFSLQRHLSTAQTAASGRPEFHVSHFRKIVAGVLASGGHEDGNANGDVLDMFYETWLSVYDDVRWFFLREAVGVMDKAPSTSSTAYTKTLLDLLTRLETFPTDQEELNAWWVSELGTKPPKPKNTTSTLDDDDDDAEADEQTKAGEDDDDSDDWRKFFDDPSPSSSSSKPNAKPTKSRLHTLTIHQSLHTLPSHRAVFTRCWLALLPRLTALTRSPSTQALGRSLSIKALNVMHRGVLPHLTRPLLTMDWLAACVDARGSLNLGLLALNGLFTLMTQYNLDYPQFYGRLYAFVDRDVMHVKGRARFMRMLEVFLGSPLLPVGLVASFVKRLGRVAGVGAGPAGVVGVLPFLYNMMKRHPGLMGTVHRDGGEGVFEDPFDEKETNPLCTGALESSLWEVQMMRRHYCATVSTLSKVFSEAFTKPGYAMEDFLDHTYATMFDTEVNRKIKREPALAMEDVDVEGRAGVGKVDLFPPAAATATAAASSLKRKREEEVGEEEGEEEEVGAGGFDVVNELWVF